MLVPVVKKAPLVNGAVPLGILNILLIDGHHFLAPLTDGAKLCCAHYLSKMPVNGLELLF